MESLLPPWDVTTQVLEALSIGNEVFVIETVMPEWARDVARYLTIGELSSERLETMKVKNRAAKFTFI